jgi:hypothetical protein
LLIIDPVATNKIKKNFFIITDFVCI